MQRGEEKNVYRKLLRDQKLLKLLCRLDYSPRPLATEQIMIESSVILQSTH